MTEIPFNSPYMTGREFEYIREACAARQLSGNGYFTKTCQQWLEQTIGCEKALLTHSGTAALEMSALLAGIGPGDEVIMPSFTFVSTANAFVLRGAVPVFVDIRGDCLNIDESKIEAAITDRTKAIVVVHYAGVACDMRAIMRIAESRGLIVIEDAAHAFLAEYNGQQLGGIGHMAAFSFHETKNITCGEGGALLLNDPRFVKRAEIIWEKGTNRAAFFRGEIDKYTWVDIGSSYLPGELGAAYLRRNSKPPKRSPGAASTFGTATKAPSTDWSKPDWRGGRKYRRDATTMLICTTCCCAALTNGSDSLRRFGSAACVRCSITCRCTRRRPASC